jgi:hypothetical protein
MAWLGHSIEHWCRRCGTHFFSSYPRHLYCDSCNRTVGLDNKRKAREAGATSRQRAIDFGKKLSSGHAASLADPPHDPNLKWLVKIAVPFSWDASKNAIYSIRANRRGKGRQLALRDESRKYRNMLISELQTALRDREIIQNKLWIDIFVEKSNHRGDAVNVVDTICDALKMASGLDDRWFCIRRLDWSINKHDPRILIGIGQEFGNPVQVCSYCGRILEFDQFSKNKHSPQGIRRVCKHCMRGK